MSIVEILFYVFAVFLITAAIGVITARNPVHCALFLVLAFFHSAVIWLLMEAEFLAIVLLLVYVGAVMVLFLFVVMMLDVKGDEAREGFWKHLPLAGLIGAVIALEMALVLIGGFRLTEAPVLDPALAKMGNTRLLGIEVYTKYLYPLQVAAVLLLVAIVAAIALTLRRRKDSRYLDAGQQVKAKKADRLRIIKMSPVIEQPSAPPAAPAAPTGDKM
jgi:NADH-quinone oxidoreductase subunit J